MFNIYTHVNLDILHYTCLISPILQAKHVPHGRRIRVFHSADSVRSKGLWLVRHFDQFIGYLLPAQWTTALSNTLVAVPVLYTIALIFGRVLRLHEKPGYIGAAAGRS